MHVCQNTRDQITNDRGPNELDQIVLCAFHALLVQTNAVVTKTWNDLKPPKTIYNHLKPPTTTSKNSTTSYNHPQPPQNHLQPLANNLKPSI